MLRRQVSQGRRTRINFPNKKQEVKPQRTYQKAHGNPNFHKQKSKLSLQYPNAQSIKMVFLGDGNSGKTSALISYTNNNFNPDYVPTIFDTYQSVIKYGDTQVRLELWDTAGQDEYKKLRSLSYPKTDLFFICFSLTNKMNFNSAIQKWLNQVNQSCPRAEVIFVGTKSDMVLDFKAQNINKIMTESQAQFLSLEGVQNKINKIGHKFVSCSALTQAGLNEMFDEGIKQVLHQRMNKSNLLKKDTDFQCQII